MTDRKLIRNLQLSNKNYFDRGNNAFFKYSPEATSKRINTDTTNLDVLFKQVHFGNERTYVESPTIFQKIELQSSVKIMDEPNKYGSNDKMLKLTKSVPSISTLSEPIRDNNRVLGFKASSKFLNSKIKDIDLRSSNQSNFADKLEKKRALWKSEHRLRELTQDILKEKYEIKTRELLTTKQPNETSHYNLDNLSRYRTSPIINNKFHHFYSELNEPPATIVGSKKLDPTVPSFIPPKPNINSPGQCAGQIQSKKSILKNPLPIENREKDNRDNHSKIEKNSQNKHLKSPNDFDSNKYNAFINTQNNSINANITVPVEQWRNEEIKSDEVKLIHSEKSYKRIKQPQDELSSAPSEHSKLHQSLNTVFEMQNKRIQKTVNYLSMPEMKISTSKKISDARKKSNELKKVNNSVSGVRGKMNVVQDSVYYGTKKEDFSELNFDDGYSSGTTHSNLQGELFGASRYQVALPSSIDSFNIGSFDDEINFNKQSKKSKEIYMQELNDEEDGKKSIHSKLEIILKEKITTINGKMREKKPTINQQFFSHKTTDELKSGSIEKDDLTKKSQYEFSLAAEQNLVSFNTEKLFENQSSYRHTFNSTDFDQFLKEKKKAPTPYHTLRLSIGDKEELMKRETLINEIKAAVLSRSTENLSKKSPETYTPHKLLTDVDFIDYTKSDTNLYEKTSDNQEDSGNFKVQKNIEEHNISSKDVFNISEDFLPVREQKSKLGHINSPGFLTKIENFPLQSQLPTPIRSELNSPNTVNPLIPNHVSNTSPLLANKKIKKTDLRPINKNAVAEMLNFHLLDKNGWDRLDETRRFLTETAVNESASINEERNNIKNLPIFQEEIFQIRNIGSSSPRKFSLTDSEFEIGRQISLGESPNLAKHIQKSNDENEKNNFDTENDISENVFEATWLSSLENESNYYKNTETEVSRSSSLNGKIGKKVKPRIIGEIKPIAMEKLHSESAVENDNKIFKMNRSSIPKVLGQEVDKVNESSFTFNKNLESNESVKNSFKEKKVVSGVNESILHNIGADMLSLQTPFLNKSTTSPRDTPSRVTSPRASTDVKWSNENYLAVNIGKISIPKNFLDRNIEESTADDQKNPPQIGDDLFEKKTTIINTDSSLNNHTWVTSKQITPRKLSIRLKQLFSPTHKRKSSLLNSDDDIARRKNINKTGAFGFENESPLNQSEDDIDEDFISNEEWKGMNDSWKSRARKENVFNPDSLRSKDDLDSLSIKRQPKIRKPLSTNTFSQKIRKDKTSTTFPITFVDKSKNESER